jgi:hypothetical protein
VNRRDREKKAQELRVFQRLASRHLPLLLMFALAACASGSRSTLDEGRIVEGGTHEELLVTGRHYPKFWGVKAIAPKSLAHAAPFKCGT